MSDKEYIESISRMNKDQLFEEVMLKPEYLTDSYYRDFGSAITKRYVQIKHNIKEIE